MTINSISNGGPAAVTPIVQASAVGKIVQQGQNVNNNSASSQPANDVADRVAAAVNIVDVQGIDNNQDQQPPKKVQAVTDQLNNFLESLNTDLRLQLHTKSGEMMVQIVDNKTHKVLREAPSHEYLDLVSKLRESLGAILDKKV